MANQPDYDKLNQVEFLLGDDRSPFVAKLQQLMAPYEEQVKSGKMTQEQYKQLGAKHSMDLLNEFMGGAIPDRVAAENFDFDRRAQQLTKDPDFKGTIDKAQEYLRKEGSQKPYARAYSVIDALKAMLPKEKVVPQTGTITEPGAPTQVAPRQPKVPRLANPQTQDEKLTDAQLQMLYNIAAGPAGMEDLKRDFNESDSYKLPVANTGSPEPVGPPTPEQQLFNAYKQNFSDWAMGNRGGEMPLPPGWVRTPNGVPVTSPAEAQEAAAGGIDKTTREKLIWENLNRMLRQEAGQE